MGRLLRAIVVVLVGVLVVGSSAATAPASRTQLPLLDTVTIPGTTKTPEYPASVKLVDGEKYTFEFSGTVAEDGATPTSKYSWDTFYCYASTNTLPGTSCNPPTSQTPNVVVKGVQCASPCPDPPPYQGSHVYTQTYFGRGVAPSFANDLSFRRGCGNEVTGRGTRTCIGNWTVKIYGPPPVKTVNFLFTQGGVPKSYRGEALLDSRTVGSGSVNFAGGRVGGRFAATGKVVHVDNFASLDVDDVELRIAIKGSAGYEGKYNSPGSEQALALLGTLAASSDKACPAKGQQVLILLHDGGRVAQDSVSLQIKGCTGHSHAYVGKKRVKVAISARR